MYLCLVVLLSATCVRGISASSGKYGTSIFRKDHILLETPIVNITGVSLVECFVSCEHNKQCKAFNFGFRNCSLLNITLCDKKNVLLSIAPGYNYYDLATTPTEEPEGKTWELYECSVMGKCAKHCLPKYIVNQKRLTWQKALEKCLDNSDCSQLAMPRNVLENEQLRYQLRKEEGDFWIGITDTDIQGNYRYYADLTNIPSSLHVAWAPGQPNNVSSENCVLLRSSDDMKWHDANCNTGCGFVCQCY